MKIWIISPTEELQLWTHCNPWLKLWLLPLGYCRNSLKYCHQYEYLVRKLVTTVLVTGKQMDSGDLNICHSCNENSWYEIGGNLPCRLQWAGSQYLHVAINSCLNHGDAYEICVCSPPGCAMIANCALGKEKFWKSCFHAGHWDL